MATDEGVPGPAPPLSGAVPPPPVQGPESHGWTIAIVAVVVVVVIAGVSIGILLVSHAGSSSSQDTITSFGFEWRTGSFCSNIAMSTPTVPFHVDGGSHFNLSWYIICQNGTGQGSTYTIQSVSVLSSGFTLVSSNVPVTVFNTHWTSLNVTLSAPSAPFSGQVFVQIGATPG